MGAACTLAPRHRRGAPGPSLEPIADATRGPTASQPERRETEACGAIDARRERASVAVRGHGVLAGSPRSPVAREVNAPWWPVGSTRGGCWSVSPCPP